MNQTPTHDTLISGALLQRVQVLAKKEKRMPSVLIAEAVERYIEEQQAFTQNNVSLDESDIVQLSSLLAEVNNVAIQENRSAGELIRDAISLYLASRQSQKQA